MKLYELFCLQDAFILQIVASVSRMLSCIVSSHDSKQLTITGFRLSYDIAVIEWLNVML